MKCIPVMILTSSSASSDIQKSYHSHANADMIKPVGLEKLLEMISTIEQFWFKLVKLVPKTTE